jgi:hypothetical protein
MDDRRFDEIARILTDHPARRALLRGFVGGLVALCAKLIAPHDADAKNWRRNKRQKRKKRRQKPQLPVPNAFGCLDVGQPCRGDSTLCCSGICEGAKPTKGKRDTSRCVAHNTGGCSTGPRPEFCFGEDVDCTMSDGTPGACGTTTGNAGYCFNITLRDQRCTKDTDCREDGFPSAACILCLASDHTHCVGVIAV